MERRKVLVLWHEGCTPASLQPVLTSIREEWAERDGGADIMLEHVDRLKSAEYSLSTFDYALLGSIPPTVYVHGSDLLEEVSRVLKTSAGISIKEPIVKDGCSSSSFRTFSQLSLSLRLAGFIEPLKVSSTPPSDEAGLIDELSKTGINVDNVLIATVQAKKPSYQLGASAPINLGGTSNYTAPLRPGPSRNNESAKIWTLAANDMLDDDVDLMDSDTLLNEEDFLRPDPSSLKSSCGPSSGKRKACKNCSCGLADELLDPSKPAVKKTVTSSCGSCYLGDAFRCASCPYLGMPAFKPGQEIKLSDRQLNVDQ